MVGSSKSRDKLIFLYKNIMSFLSNLDIEIILFYGSLLGLLRESNFIEDDDDIDVLIDRKHYNKLIESINHYNNTNTKNTILNKSKNKDIVALYFNGLGPFDIYIFDIDDNKGVIEIKWEKELFNITDIFPTKKVNLHSYTLYIPNNSKKIIEKVYGKDWSIPNKKGNKNYVYNKVRDKGNIIENKHRYIKYLVIFILSVFIIYIIYKLYN